MDLIHAEATTASYLLAVMDANVSSFSCSFAAVAVLLSSRVTFLKRAPAKVLSFRIKLNLRHKYNTNIADGIFALYGKGCLHFNFGI